MTAGKLHPVLRSRCNSAREASRLPARLRILTGTYILQVNRARFNQIAVCPTCPLCGLGDETPQHFILDCCALESIRNPIMVIIYSAIETHDINAYIPTKAELFHVILDYSTVLPPYLWEDECAQAIEYHARRLIYALHSHRYRLYLELW